MLDADEFSFDAEEFFSREETFVHLYIHAIEQSRDGFDLRLIDTDDAVVGYNFSIVGSELAF